MWIVFFIVCFFMTTLAVSLVRLTFQYYTRKQDLRKTKQVLSDTKREYDTLRAQAKYSTTDNYIEEEARRRAMSKPGEQVIIGTFPTLTPQPTPVVDQRAPYQQWFDVYFTP